MAVGSQAKAVQRGDRGCGLLGPGDVVPDALAEIFKTVGAEQEPELEGSEPTAQRDAPLTVIGNLGLAERLQIIGTDAERTNLRFRVREELDRAVELRAEPLVGVEDDAVGILDALPQIPQFRTDHR